MFYAAGVLHIALLQRYDQSVTLTAWLGSLFCSTFALAGPLSSFVINKFSCRVCVVLGGLLNLIGFASSAYCEQFYVLFLTYGIIAGIGQCLAYTGSVIVLGFYFEKRRTLATGVAVTGSGLATITFPPMTQAFYDVYGFHGSFLLLGAVAFQTCVFGALLRPHPTEKERRKQISPSQKFTCRAICKTLYEYLMILYNKAFTLYLASILSWCISLAINIMYLPDYFHDNGSSLVEASLMISAMGFGSLVSRILTGLAAVGGAIDPKTLYFGCYGILGILTMILPVFVIHYGGKLAYSVILGLYSGGTWSLLSSICVDLVGIHNLASAFGLVMFIAGVGFLIGPVIGSYVEKLSGNFGHIFIFSGIMFLLASVFGMVMSLYTHPQDKNEDSGKPLSPLQNETEPETESFLKPVDCS